TAMTLGGTATGLLVTSHMGRPTKNEGNPKHPSVPAAHGTADDPARAGASDILSQAAILSLYDPDRSQAVTWGGQISTWDAFLTQLRQRRDAQPAGRGHRLRVLTETVGSPTLLDQLKRLEAKWPEVWIEFEP